jgi:hypothetical protein
MAVHCLVLPFHGSAVDVHCTAQAVHSVYVCRHGVMSDVAAQRPPLCRVASSAVAKAWVQLDTCTAWQLQIAYTQLCSSS